jgi:hypothetical protein
VRRHAFLNFGVLDLKKVLKFLIDTLHLGNHLCVVVSRLRLDGQDATLGEVLLGLAPMVVFQLL